jgi:enoyl-CoA hydratase
MTPAPRITTELRDHVLHIGLHRADKRNAFDLAMLRGLAEALTRGEDDPEVRCHLLFGHGEHFTAGLDLAEVGPAVAAGAPLFPDGAVDPLGLFGRLRSKPLVVALQGWCLTIGIELALAADIRVAASDTRFGQIEIKRGIFPFGGATLRMPTQLGWGNAMRYLLTGDTFDAAEAHRIGLVQELAEPSANSSRAPPASPPRSPARPRSASRPPSAPPAPPSTDGPRRPRPAARRRPAPSWPATTPARACMSFLERREARFTGR